MSTYQLAKNLSMNTRTISYLPSLSALLQRIRYLIHHPSPIVINRDRPIQTLVSDSSDILNDICHSLKDKTTELAGKPVIAGGEKLSTFPNLFTIDKNFPLPNFTGLSQHHISSRLDIATQSGSIEELLTPQIPKCHETLFQEPCLDPKVEILIQQSPTFLLKSFLELMPDIPELTDKKLNVICLSEHTNSDMSKWSFEMNQEREELTINFINSAKEICGRIKENGFWSDFIDPSSGQPYLGNRGTNQLTEIDDRMRHFGFLVEDFGCCKCVRHSTWGYNVFVGVIFTTAPADSKIMSSFINL